MGIESSLAARKVKDLLDLPRETTTNVIKSKKNRRRNKKMTPVQRLFEMCKDVFAAGGSGIIPPPEDIQRLQSVLDDIKPEDVGLSPDLPYFRSMGEQQPPTITYLHLHECSKFSMGIFCLPPSGVIPLHNHPGMTVFSKLLLGSMHIKSYDWVVDAARGGSDDPKRSPIVQSQGRLGFHCPMQCIHPLSSRRRQHALLHSLCSFGRSWPHILRS